MYGKTGVLGDTRFSDVPEEGKYRCTMGILFNKAPAR
jgi:hypothetical protein